MELKLAYSTFLSLAALVVCGAQSSFMPPASTTCLAANFATGGDFLDCCPTADPNDGICTLIWCIQPDSLTIRDNCDCGQVETACEQLSMFTGMVDGLAEACTAMSGCCEAGVTSNEDFASCTEDAIAMSNITIPDIGGLVPGGVPDLDSLGSMTTTTKTTTAAATEGGETATTAVPEDETKGATTSAAPETEATMPAATGAEKSTSGAANGHAFDVAIALIGTSFALVFM